MTTSVNRQYIPEVDQLRAFAALLVFFYHCLQLFGAKLTHGGGFDPLRDWLYPNNPILAIIEEGHTGVGLFITLSGFILSNGAISKTVLYGPFLRARILRIYPMYLLCLVVAMHMSTAGIGNVLTSLLPLNLAGGVQSAFTGMFWTIAVEFQCYLIFPFLIIFSNQRGSRFLWQVVLLALLIRLLAISTGQASARDLSYWTVIGRIDQFCIGMIAARYYLRLGSERIPAFCFPLCAIVSGAILVGFNKLGGWPIDSPWKILWPSVEAMMWAAFILLWLPCGRYLPGRLSRGAARIGEISYSFYLLHFAILIAVLNTNAFLRLTGTPYLDALLTGALVALPITFLFATLCYYTVEMPFLRLRSGYIRRRDANGE